MSDEGFTSRPDCICGSDPDQWRHRSDCPVGYWHEANELQGKLGECEKLLAKEREWHHEECEKSNALTLRLISCENEVSVRTDERDGAISLLRQAEERNKELESRLDAALKKLHELENIEKAHHEAIDETDFFADKLKETEAERNELRRRLGSLQEQFDARTERLSRQGREIESLTSKLRLITAAAAATLMSPSERLETIERICGLRESPEGSLYGRLVEKQRMICGASFMPPGEKMPRTCRREYGHDGVCSAV